MVASISSSDREDTTMPSLVAATPSPGTTPSRTKTSPKQQRNTSDRTRRKRLTPEDNVDSPPKAAPSHELFGDYMSIEEIAAQTEKAYQSRKLKSPSSSPIRAAKPVSPKVSPRRLPKKKLDVEIKPVAKKSSKGGTVLLAVFVVTIVLPFLLCESLLLLLTLQYRDGGSGVNTSTVGVDTLRDIQDVHLEPSVQVDESDLTADDDEIVDKEEEDGIDESFREESIEIEVISTMKDTVLSEDTDEISSDMETEVQQEELETIEQVEEQTTEIQPNGQVRKQQKDAVTENEAMLQEAFSLIAAARSISTTKWSKIEQLTSAEILCRTVAFRAKEMALMADEPLVDNAIDDDSEAKSQDPWEAFYFKSSLCIGGAKMSMSIKDVDRMIQDAKQVFEHLSVLDPYSLEAQAGLGTSILAQGILYSASNATTSKNDVNEQTSLLTLATFHLKLASSLCSHSYKQVTGSTKDLPASDDVDIRNTVPNMEHPNHVAHAAILHNLALAYIALGDSNSSTPLLLRAAAIHRQLLPSKQNELLWNLPNEVLQLVEEKAWLLGAKAAAGEKKKKPKKKRRIPFVPESFTFDEMVAGM